MFWTCLNCWQDMKMISPKHAQERTSQSPWLLIVLHLQRKENWLLSENHLSTSLFTNGLFSRKFKQVDSLTFNFSKCPVVWATILFKSFKPPSVLKLSNFSGYSLYWSHNHFLMLETQHVTTFAEILSCHCKQLIAEQYYVWLCAAISCYDNRKWFLLKSIRRPLQLKGLEKLMQLNENWYL